MNNREFENELKKLNIELTEYQKEQLQTYANFLMEYNKHTNLTAIKDIDGIYLKHFYDSLTVSKIADFSANKKVIDIGTGAGFPGLVLKIVYPNISLTLLDSNHKKTDFLKLCCEKLNITDVTIINDRAENYAKQNTEKFDYAVSRAVAELRILCELNIPMLKIGGSFLAMKADIEEEIKLANIAIQKLGAKIIKKEEFNLPIENSKRTLIEINKISKTDSIYPRAYDRIIKKPIK